jgi:hypothetical protein
MREKRSLLHLQDILLLGVVYVGFAQVLQDHKVFPRYKGNRYIREGLIGLQGLFSLRPAKMSSWVQSVDLD